MQTVFFLKKENNSKVINSGEELIKKFSRIITCMSYELCAKNAAEDVKA